MNFHSIITGAQSALKDNAPSIMTGVGVAGTVGTAILAAKGAFKACRLIDESESNGGTAGDVKQRLIERAKLTWKCYIPAVGSGVVTIAAVLGSNQVNAKRTAAAITAYSLTETAFSEYKEQVVKTIGVNKDQKIRDEVAQERVSKTAPDSSVVLWGTGDVLCEEAYTNRYFMCTAEKLRRAMNAVNDRILHEGSADLNDFYDEIEIQHTQVSSGLGWDLESGLMGLDMTSCLTMDERPCLSFSYGYLKPV